VLLLATEAKGRDSRNCCCRYWYTVYELLLHLGASYEIADRQLSYMYTQHIHIALRLLHSSALLRGNATCLREMRSAKFARRCAWFIKGNSSQKHCASAAHVSAASCCGQKCLFLLPQRSRTLSCGWWLKERNNISVTIFMRVVQSRFAAL